MKINSTPAVTTTVGYFAIKGQAGLVTHEAGCDQLLCFLSFRCFSTCQNNLLHNLNRHYRETGRLELARVILVAHAEDRDNISQLPVSWGLYRFPGPFQNHWQVSQWHQLAVWGLSVVPIKAYRFIAMQLDQQIPYNFRFNSELILTALFLLLRALRHP